MHLHPPMYDRTCWGPDHNACDAELCIKNKHEIGMKVAKHNKLAATWELPLLGECRIHRDQLTLGRSWALVG